MVWRESERLFASQYPGKCPIYLTDPVAEVSFVRTFYESTVYKKLLPHQRVLTVPPVYACSEFALAAQDNYVRRSIEAYAQWGWQDDRTQRLALQHKAEAAGRPPVPL